MMKVVAVFLSDETTTRRLALAFRGRCAVQAFANLRGARDAFASGRVLAAVVDMRQRGVAGDTDALGLIARLRTNWPTVPVVGHLSFTPHRARDIMAAAHAGAAEIILCEFDDIDAVANRIADAALASEVAARFEAATVTLLSSQLRAFMSCAIKNARLRLNASAVAARLCIGRKRLARKLATAGLPKPAQMLNWARLLVAVRMLDEGTRSTEKIARELGFPSGSALRNLLYRYLGCAPEMLRALGGFDYALAEFVRLAKCAHGPRAAASEPDGVATPRAARATATATVGD